MNMWKNFAFFAPLSLHAVTPGAWETFPSETSATSWALYDFADQETYFPSWLDDSAAGADANPFIGANFAADPNPPEGSPTYYNQALWFFADEFAADGAFYGDFAAAGVAGIEVDVLITNPDLLLSTDITLISTESGQPVTYYSQDYSGSAFPSTPTDWVTLYAAFDQDWFIFDVASQLYVTAEITPEVLADVVEVGIRFYPTETSESIWSPFIDNFALTPTIITPTPVPSFSGSDFVITFDTTQANRYDIQKFNLTNKMWEDFVGFTDLVPTQSNYTFETSISPAKELFRVRPEANYTPVFSNTRAPRN